MLNFQPFTPSMKDKIIERLQKINTTCYEYQYSYYLLYGETAGIFIAFDDEAMYTYVKKLKAFLMPATNNMCAAIKQIKGHCEQTGTPFCIRAVPEEYISLFTCCTTILDRNLSDYLYTPQNMITLAGRHLQPKRNHIKQFEKNYDAQFSPLTKEDKPLCFSFLNTWYKEHQASEQDEDLLIEQRAIEIAFNNLDLFIGEKVVIDGHLVGFTIGQIVNNGKLAIVHFEKADTSYTGAYPSLNNHFAKNYLFAVELINREEDMGIEGLRKAKLSYQPIKIGNKFCIIL